MVKVADQREDRLTKVFGLAGLTAAVTGAGSGLAETIAINLALAGAFVWVGDNDFKRAEAVVEAIHAQGGMARPVLLDVTLESSVVAAFEQIGSAGQLDVLVNGATMVGGCELTEMSIDQWDGMQAVNLRGAFLSCREALRLMKREKRGGRIINLSTIGAVQPVLYGNSAYGASKAGLNQLTRSLAFDHARDGVLVNAILPGVIPGNAPRMPGTIAGDGPGKIEDRRPHGVGRPDDVGWLAVYLAGPAARYVTGQCIAVDGGFQVS